MVVRVPDASPHSAVAECFPFLPGKEAGSASYKKLGMNGTSSDLGSAQLCELFLTRLHSVKAEPPWSA